MRRIWMGALLPAAACGGCLAFAPPPAGSRCVVQSAELQWTNAPAKAPASARLGMPYHPELRDAAFSNGVAVAGEQRFTLAAQGPQVLEVLLANPEIERHVFQLEAGGRVLDARPVIAPGPARLRPKRGQRSTSLLAVVSGPAELRLQTDAPRYTLVALRWTPQEQFERERVPLLVAAARQATTKVLTEAEDGNPTQRRAWMQQLWDRVALSRAVELRAEALLGRTRAWFWKAAEDHEPDEILQTHLLFEEGLRIMPENPVLRQMIAAACLGQVVAVGRMPSGPYCESVKPIPWQPDIPPAPAGAPEWAVEQRRLMRRLEALTRWWVEERQAANGELGGGWGDDVEILRHWGPQALGFSSAVAGRGVRRVADGVWASGTLQDGYNRSVTDVEHSAEPTTDTIPLALALNPGDAELRRRAATTAACLDHWLARQPDGFFRFRSSWYNCQTVDTANGRDVDVHLNTRAVGPALWHAYLTRDRALIARLAGWADAWIAAMRKTDHGKPAGVFPPAMRAADGSYLVGSQAWDKPAAEWDYFQWSGGAQESLASLVLAVYDLTGDRKYLDAVRESFTPLRNCAAHEEICRALRAAPEAFLKWRALTGDASFDAAFGYRPDPPDTELLAAMTRAGQRAAERFSYNWNILTNEVLYTDRIYYPLPAEYRWRLFGGEAPRGDRYPFCAVTWPAAQQEFARAVLAFSGSALRLRLHSFAAAETRATVRLWRLRPGRYEWRAGARRGEIEIAACPHDWTLPLPPGVDLEVTLRLQERPSARR